VITAVRPLTLSSGTSTSLVIQGKNLTAPLRLKASRATVSIPVEKVEPDTVLATAALPAHASLGPLAVWPSTEAGPLPPIVMLIDDLPVHADNGNNHTRDTAQSLPSLACVDGTSDGGKSDMYRFQGKAGQRVAVEVLTLPIRSTMDPVVRLVDADGTVLAMADDGAAGPECRLSHTFAKTGDCWLEIRDNSYKTGAGYHLRLGDFPIISHAFPLAVQRGTTTRIGFTGADGAAAVASEVTVASNCEDSSLTVATRLPGGRSSAWARVLVHDAPQVVEPEDSQGMTAALTIPVGISGRLDNAGERDSYRLMGTKGHAVRISARTRSLGCATVPRMRLHSVGPNAADAASNKLIAETDSRNSAEATLDFTFPEDGEYRLEVSDLAGRGGNGFGYFLAVERVPPVMVELKPVVATRESFAIEAGRGCAAVDVKVTRTGYDGEIVISLTGEASGLRVVNPVIPAKATEARLYLAADAGWTEESSALVRLRAECLGQPSSSTSVVSTAVRRLKEPHVPFPPDWADGVLSIAGVKAGEALFAIEPPAPVSFTRGTAKQEIKLPLKRLDPAFTGVVTILGSSLPKGFSLTSTFDKESCQITLTGTAADGSEPTSMRLFAVAEQKNRGRIEQVDLPVVWSDPVQPPATDAQKTNQPGEANKPSQTNQEASPPAQIAAATVTGTPPFDVFPHTIALDGARDRQQVAVTSVDAAGLSRDLTRQVSIVVANESVATVRGTVIIPAGDGTTEAVITLNGSRVTVPITVTHQAVARPRQFENEVLVALSKQTCSSGACHGSPSGKGGFRLSLRGFDEPFDETTLIREDFGRRVNPLEPEASLLLRKPLMKLAHGGGRQLLPRDEAYAILRDWIAEGAKADPPDTPRCVRLAVTPGTRQVQQLEAGGRQLVTIAHFSDGSSRDVTHLAAYESSHTGVATVDAHGWTTPHRRGEAVILVRYLEHITPVPLMFIEDVPGFAWKAPPEINVIDRLVNEKLRELRYLPAEPCTDAEFLRRASLDITGALPPVRETEAFLADTSADKRATLVDQLLTRDEYARFWALKWGDLLRVTKKHAGEEGIHKYHRWIEDSFRRNEPHDTFARQLLLGSGSTLANPPANFYRTVTTTEETVETVSQVFLGVRLQCAKCHNHPFDHWTQDNYYGMAAFFDRVKTRKTEQPGETIVYAADSGETKQPRTGKTMKPWLPTGEVDADATGDRRAAFTDWLVSPGNPSFARVEANRIWSQFFARGIVDPVDEFRDSNPPCNAVLLDALARDFADGGFDRKRLIRLICTSQTYQASCRTSPLNRDDAIYFSHQQPRLLGAEQLLDAIDEVTGVEQPYGTLPAGTRAVELPGPDLVKVDFLKTFGKPQRGTVCACERADDSSLGMAIELINGRLMNEKVASPTNRIRPAVAAGRPVEAIVRELYLAALCRVPTEEELQAAVALCQKARDPVSGLEDVCWALLNTDEFVFQH
jgi:hypothetical protein